MYPLTTRVFHEEEGIQNYILDVLIEPAENSETIY